jgi:hypothetical protein
VYRLASLECKNCLQPIRLLYATRHETLERLRWWPTDKQPLNFLCPDCKHVYEYKAQDIHLSVRETLGQDQPHKGQGVFCICIRCEAKGCASLAKIHVLMNAPEGGPTSPEGVESARQLLAEAIIPVGIFCESEDVHPVKEAGLRRGAEQLSPIDVRFVSFVDQAP